MHLMEDLRWVSRQWVSAHSRTNKSVSLKTLGSRAVGDAKLFPRLDAGRPITVPIYEKVICFLADSERWPAALLPDDVAERLALIGCDGVGVRVYVERETVERKLVVRA
jgi:hypothetical protein